MSVDLIVNPVTLDIRDVLVGANEGEWAGTGINKWAINIGTEPADPILSITLYDFDALPAKSMSTDTIFEKAPFQVRTRHADYNAAYQKLMLIKRVLLKKTYWAVGGAAYKRITKGIGPFYMKQDEQRRHRWVQTFVAHREYSEGTD